MRDRLSNLSCESVIGADVSFAMHYGYIFIQSAVVQIGGWGDGGGGI